MFDIQGKLYGWGYNEENCLGITSESKDITFPTQLPWSSHLEVVDIGCGEDFTVVLVNEKKKSSAAGASFKEM